MLKISTKNKAIAGTVSRAISVAALAAAVMSAPAWADFDRMNGRSVVAACGEVPSADMKKSIIDAALAYGVEPEVALAVAKAGSDFAPDARGPAGGLGVMQVRPVMAEQAFGVDADALWDTDRNIDIGTSLLSQLYRYSGDSWEIALARYANAGASDEGRAFVDAVLDIRDGYHANWTVQCYVRYLANGHVLAGSPSPLAADETFDRQILQQRRQRYANKGIVLPEASSTFYPYGYDRRQLALKERFVQSLEDHRSWKQSLEASYYDWD
ncbi:hypothetical protein HAD_06050 [Hyphomonas adhaerens MHS-3]|uniref:Transglycosylase SLT domain-containing protein n=1 Tax=Hyphomonas adhaerens MHS-3 TaxID=1280949 RepID=A0A069E941_9PROT|nr:transglycosylase SLT domain-containing protein [Hyphomonas adhaerens]KCZ85221.1 hypothetical protein HAD_06050 [Hyphomonas adhaerens MHS-3]